MRTVKSPQKKPQPSGKLERLQKLYFFNLVKLYAMQNDSQQSEYALNGVRVAIKRLEDFWQEQKNSWKEIRDISDEECQSPDSFFEEDVMPSAKHSLPTIIENEEEQQDNALQKEIEGLWKVVNRLKEAENRILERYKCELKALAVDLKSSEERNKAHEITIEGLQSRISRQAIEVLKQEVAKKEDEDTYRKLQSNQRAKNRTQTNSKMNLLNTLSFDKATQTLQISDEGFDDKEYYQLLYQNEREKLTSLERRFTQLKDQYLELERGLHNSFDDPNDLEDQFKKELTIELSSLKNKITMLTEQANQAESMLIEKDQQLKDLHKVNQSLQQDLTQKRAQQTVIVEEKKTIEANLKLLQSINKRLETENARLVAKDQQPQPKIKEVVKSVSNPTKTQKEATYKGLHNELQALHIENQELRGQLATAQRQLKEISEAQRSQQTSDRAQLMIAAKEIEKLRTKLYEQEEIIATLEQQQQNVESEMIEEKVNENLNEAMEYLEQKDKEIEKLRTENDSLRFQLIHYEKQSNYRDGRNSPSGKYPHPSDAGQLRDLQNLLMVMSKTLQEKEDLLKKYQHRA